MKYDDLTFEEKIALKIEYVLTLPATTETKVILDNLKWVLEIYSEEKKNNETKKIK